jgi:hypothetical protein
MAESVTRIVVAGRPIHVAGRPRGPASTDFHLRIPCYRLLESVTMKPTHERLQSGASQTGHPLGPLVSSLCTLPHCVRYIPGVTLILVEFQISL